jgi:GntR family transcriptional regulator/MocR family aminotransferase
MRSVQGREIVITHGSQEGIFLAAQSFIRPGDRVAVEALGYPPAFEAFRMAGAQLVPIPVDGEGMQTSVLAQRVRAGKIAMIYTTPLHQYPTTVTMSPVRRRELYQIAARARIPIIEDDYDHEFHYECQPIAPLASDDPKGIVIYVSSFSKVLLPSIRLGFLAVPPELADHFVALRRLTTRQNDALVQETIARWMEDGGFERHLRRTRRLYRERRDAVVHEVEALASAGRTKWSCQIPDGGMTLWLHVGEDSEKLAKRAAKLGIALDAEQRFRLDGQKGTHFRLGFARHTPSEAREGLRLLRHVR